MRSLYANDDGPVAYATDVDVDVGAFTTPDKDEKHSAVAGQQVGEIW